MASAYYDRLESTSGPVPWGRSRAAYLSDLDGRFLVDAQQGDVGDADEGPLLVGPEHDDGASLGGLGGHVEVGEADATQVGSQANEDVPAGTAETLASAGTSTRPGRRPGLTRRSAGRGS